MTDRGRVRGLLIAAVVAVAVSSQGCVGSGATPAASPASPQPSAVATGLPGAALPIDVAVSPLGNAGMPMHIKVTPSDDQGAIADASVVATITDPSGKVRRFDIPDAGYGDDPMAGDGIYAQDVWATSLPGTYSVSVTATGVDHDGSPFSLTSSTTVDLAAGVDSDGDSITDQAEALLGLDPHDPGDAQIDMDRDGLTWAQELAAGTDWQNADTDLGGETDGSEVARGLDPLNPTDDARPGAISFAAVAQDGRTVGLILLTYSSVGSVQITRIGPDGQTTTVATLPAGQQSLMDGPLPAGTYTYEAVLTLPSGARAPIVTSQPVVVGDDVTAPRFDFTLEGNRNETTETTVHIWVTETSEKVSQMRVAESRAALDAAPWVPFAMHSIFELTSDLGDHAVYVQLRDTAGNVSAPLSQVITLVVGNAPPSSFAEPLNRYVSDTDLSVGFISMFPNGIGLIQLWERHTPEGGLAGKWSRVASATKSPFSIRLASGPGKYEFYTIAIDAQSRSESPPSEADTWVVLANP